MGRGSTLFEHIQEWSYRLPAGHILFTFTDGVRKPRLYTDLSFLDSGWFELLLFNAIRTTGTVKFLVMHTTYYQMLKYFLSN